MTMTPDMTLCSAGHKDDTFPPGCWKMIGENVMESHHHWGYGSGWEVIVFRCGLLWRINTSEHQMRIAQSENLFKIYGKSFFSASEATGC